MDISDAVNLPRGMFTHLRSLNRIKFWSGTFDSIPEDIKELKYLRNVQLNPAIPIDEKSKRLLEKMKEQGMKVEFK